MTEKSEIIKEYLRKFPDTHTRTLSRIIYSNHEIDFTSLENVRSMIRFYRGQNGNENRKKVIDTTFFKEAGTVNVYKSLPDPILELGEWSLCEIQGNKAAIFADIHIPFHDKQALTIAIEYIQKQNIDSIVLLGDIVDFYALSRFIRNPKLRNFGLERKQLISFLALLRHLFPNVNIYYKIGNHEERYEQYIMVHAPEFYDEELFSFDALIKAEQYGIEIINDRRIMTFGKLNLVHGHEFGRSLGDPVNPARWLYLQGKEHCLCGHLHRTSSHSENSMRDSFTTTFSVGTLCCLRPKYKPINKWNHGFSIVERSGKDFQVHNKKIINNTIFSA